MTAVCAREQCPQLAVGDPYCSPRCAQRDRKRLAQLSVLYMVTPLAVAERQRITAALATTAHTPTKEGTSG